MPTKMKSVSSTCLLISSALLALTAGCAITPEARMQTAPGSIRLADGQGVLALKVTSNRPSVSTFFAKWTTLRVTNTDRNEQFTLTDRSDSSAGHSLFVESLPAGAYLIDAVGNQASGWLTITEGAKAGASFPGFRIAGGQLTHLGTLVYVRKHFPINSAEYRWGQSDSPFDREAALRQLEPLLAKRLAAAPVLGWDEGPALQQRKATLAESRPHTMRLDSPVRMPDGGLLFGESFGQLAIRTQGGDWRWYQTPGVLPIRSVYRLSNGKVLAGSDDALLLLGSLESGQWEPLPLPVNDASVIYIGELPKSGRIVVILQTRVAFVGLSTDLGQPAQWKEEFTRPRAIFSNPLFDARGKVLVTGGRPLLITGSAQAELDSVAFVPPSGTWKSAHSPESLLPDRMVSVPNDSIGMFKGVPLTGMYFATSDDYGVTWEKRGELNWAQGSVLFISPSTGFAVRTDSIPAMDPEKFELSIWRTDDAGRNWSKVGPTPGTQGALIQVGDGEQLAYATFNGKFFVSRDGGKSWAREREVP